MVALAIVGSATAVRANDWRTALSMAQADARNHPESSRCQYEAGRALAEDGARRGMFAAVKAQAVAYIRRAAELDPYQVPPSAALVIIHGTDEPVPQDEVDMLAERLRSARSNEQANPFLDLLVNASNGRLALTPEQVAMLFDAASANPGWTKRVRSMMLNNYGAYQFNVGGDAQEAFRLTEKAREVDPANPYFPLNLAKMSVARGDAKSAAVYLADAVRLDTLMQYRNDIAELQQSLQQ
jgi:predicted Zn-dependent protease